MVGLAFGRAPCRRPAAAALLVLLAVLIAHSHERHKSRAHRAHLTFLHFDAGRFQREKRNASNDL
jgi:hypothetical protein